MQIYWIVEVMSRYARDGRDSNIGGEDGRDDSRGRSPPRREIIRDGSSSPSNEDGYRRRMSPNEILEAPMPGAWTAAEESKVPSWDLVKLLPEPRSEGWIPPTPPRVHMEQGMGQFKDAFKEEIFFPPRFKISDKETVLRENRDIEEREPLVILNNLCIVRTDLRSIKDSKRMREKEDREEEREFSNSGFRERGGRGRGSSRGNDKRENPNSMPVGGERRRFGRDGDRGSVERGRRPPSPVEHRPPTSSATRRNEDPRDDGDDRRHGHSSRTVKSHPSGSRRPRSPMQSTRPLSPLKGVGGRSNSSSSSNTTGRMSSFGRGSVSGAGTPASPSASYGGNPVAAETYKEHRERKEREDVEEDLLGVMIRERIADETYKEHRERKEREAGGQ